MIPFIDKEERLDLRNEYENDKALEELNEAHRQAIADMSRLDKIKEAPAELVVEGLCRCLHLDHDTTVEDMLNNDINGSIFHERMYQLTIDLAEFDFTDIDEYLFQEGIK